MNNKNAETKFNIVVFVSFIIVIFLIFGLRLFQIGVVNKVNDVALSPMDYKETQLRSSNLPKQRGSILDAKDRPIAVDATSYSIYANVNPDSQDSVQDIDQTARVLSEVLSLSVDEVIQILKTPGASQVEFGTEGQGLSLEQKRLIEQAELSGIYFTEHPDRHYTNDYFASHLIGYTAPEQGEESEQENAENRGQMGIEYAYDDLLNDYQINEGENGLASGRNIRLTIEGNLQSVLEDLIQQSYLRYAPKNISAYLVEVESGRLLTAAQRPSFNLNTLDGIETEWRNLLVENVYEPGSTIKILTTAIAYEMGIVKPTDRFLSGEIDLYGTTVRDYNLTGWGQITYDQGLIHSSNVGVARLVEMMGVEAWQEALARFGFGQTTDSGLPNENAGTITFDNPVSTIMSGFGQGLLTSPIQLLQAYSSIGNEGRMMKLQYIDQIQGREKTAPIVLQDEISPEVANHILEVMVQTVQDPNGTAQDFNHEKVRVAAKTGTAQIADPNGNGYLTGENDYYFSVISFFPAEDPKYMLYISMQQPSTPGNKTGSQIISELFHPFVDYVLIND
ncbi:penicillin-binding protein 2 [Aerococcaceae bacterium DSM 111020]|nr:penicillin-binding protein 2 [Aerococcaceae bacterium DSM 111020]